MNENEIRSDGFSLILLIEDRKQSGKDFEGLDRVYNHISQTHAYALVIYNLCALTWFTGGFAVISTSFMNARPGYTLAAYNRKISIFLEYIACYNETNTDFESYEEFCR